MVIEIFWSDKLKMGWEAKFKEFTQRMANRLMQGHPRYGLPNRRQRYMSRAIAELKAYEKTGNAEQLYNAANYLCLESIEPENKKFHFDNRVGSVTRGKFGV